MPDSLIRHAKASLRKTMLFGADFPMIASDKWLAAPLKGEDRRLILKDNAMRLTGET